MASRRDGIRPRRLGLVYRLGHLFAPVLAVLSPWPAVTAVLWGIIGLAGLWLGLLGIAMAVGLARVLRSGAEIPERYWRSLVNY
jgi:hypothetical protein